ncbi:SirB2 family protein [Deefgea piscis]|uniref:SirB2 family protein n=1 Tax=Deefgea piscis TaxID=2739061 RepID=A0A6M8SLU0_9NEIS|nr:SirB2 family protein [Deefgea piscis]QKJ66053.1 SirB2 family protein [Deefgea piscis]
MEYYLGIKHLHLTLIGLSGLLFLLRGVLMLKQSAMLQHPVLRISPHIIDTGLLIAGFSLALMAGMKPGAHLWLMAKLIALALYIILGTIAIKRGKTYRTRVIAFIAAIAVFVYMIFVAISKNPMIWA